MQNGADAVYMGFGAFNARRNARNFTDEEFSAAVDYCHLHGVKVYLTLNTLVSDRELEGAADALRKAAQMGVDAVLVQDWGILHLAKQVAPVVPLHASTQMSLHTLGGANAARALGMERVVLARELSGREVEEICRGCEAEIEVFGHGALCMCYSGQCAMSALIGGRSGNRGTCAQPCRLPYGVNEKEHGGHPLSLKDANLSGFLNQMREIGVSCVKLEGRMKRPEYVAAVTGIYRRLLDEKRGPTRQEQQQLEQAFSRSGFTDGYWLGQKGGQMFGVRPEDAKWPEAWFAEVRKTYENGFENRPVSVAMTFSARTGQPAQLTATLLSGPKAGASVALSGPIPETARNRSVTESEIKDRLMKTGGTAFRVRTVTAQVEDGLMLSAGAINGMRRAAIDELCGILTEIPARRIFPTPPLPEANAQAPAKPRLTISVSRAEQLSEELARGAEILYLPVELLDQVDTERYSQLTELCAILPRIFRTADEEKLRETLKRHPEVKSAAIGNLGHLPIVNGLNLSLRGDFGLNIFNSRALLLWRELGLESATVSFELRHQQVRELKKYLPCEAIVYGRLPLMIMENCVTQSNVGCAHGGGSHLLDRTGADFPILCSFGCRGEIENSRTLFLADKPEWQRCGLTWGRLRFTTEDADTCRTVLRRYQGQGDWMPADHTRGLFYRGVE